MQIRLNVWTAHTSLSFLYNAAKEELYVQVAEVAHEYKKGDKNDDQWKAFLKENNNSTWTQSGTSEPLEIVKDEYIYMSQLNGMNVLTVNVAKDEDGVGTRKGTDGSGNKLYPVLGDQERKGYDRNEVHRLDIDNHS